MPEYKVVITETRSYRVNADSADSAKWKAMEVHGSKSFGVDEKGSKTEYVNIEEVLEPGAYDRWQYMPDQWPDWGNRWQCEFCPWVEGCDPIPGCDEGLW